MRLLLDTHLLLWALAEPARLPAGLAADLQDSRNEIYFSAASIWEIAIKQARGRADFAVQPEEIATAAVETGFTELPVRWQAAAAVATLQAHHRDPFDRLLVAQAMTELLMLYTADRQLSAYSHLVRLI
jgi:PIN domain nuclease of toxin-antitoxin system